MQTAFPLGILKACRLCIFFLILVIMSSGLSAKESKSLIRVKDAQGRETALLEKVVVVSGKATLAKTPQDAGEPIEPWAIYFRLKNDDGTSTPVQGKLRVGDGAGKHVGWIGKDHVRSWNTRFILDPIEPQPQRKFVVNTDGGGKAEQNATPEGKRRYALISDQPATEAGDDTEYPIIVYAGNVQGQGQGGTLAKQRNELRDVKMEIMFVIESSDFMFIKEKDEEKSLLDHVKSSIRELIAELRKDEEIRKAVRLGFAEYKDNVTKASFTSRLTCDLTDDFDRFSNGLDKMAASKLEDDWPDDVIAGLNEAAFNATWSNNSVKHIIQLGMASCQLTSKGNNPPQLGKKTELGEFVDNLGDKGHNSTGMSIQQLISRARPQGGSDSRARSSRSFHALHFGRDLLSDLTDDQRNDLKEATEIVNELSLEQVNQEAKENPKFIELVKTIIFIQIYENQRKLALAQYKEISENNREADGYFQSVEPTEEARQNAVSKLSVKIADTFKILEQVRDGQGLPTNSGNELAQPLFTLVGAAAEKFKDQPVITGTATVRDQKGREIAFKKVMVSEDELRHLRSTLDALFTKFSAKTGKADRQDVGSILETMKEILVETGSGQDVSADVKLKDLISDLPLRTPALDTTASDLALMTTESFKEWLEKIQGSILRIDDLLKNKQEWLTLSDTAVNEKFTFLRLSELP